MGVNDQGISGDREFPLTSWSVIAHARDADSPDYARHLHRLIEVYWRPVYGFIRHSWAKTHEDAKDLTQDFFATVVLDRELVSTYARERGSFRTFLRTTIRRFLHDVERGRTRQKRGDGLPPLALDAMNGNAAAIVQVPNAHEMTPDQVFDAAWTAAVMNEALALLGKRLAAEGKTPVFEMFRRYDIEGGGAELSYAELGAEFSLSTPQVKHALLAARAAFREVVTDVVRTYVDDPADLAAELRSLFGG